MSPTSNPSSKSSPNTTNPNTTSTAAPAVTTRHLITLQTTTTSNSGSFCGTGAEANDPTCGLQRFLLGLVCFVVCLALVLCIARILFLYCAIKRRRTMRPSSRETFAPRHQVHPDIDDLGHPFSYIAEAGFDNCGFIEPPPTYDQLYKRDEPPPTYVNSVPTPATPGPPSGAAVEQARQQQAAPQEERAQIEPTPTERSHEPSVASRSATIRSSTRSSAVSENLPGPSTASGNLPTGAFGTSGPPNAHAVLPDVAESFRARAFTEQSLAEEEDHPRDNTSLGTVPGDSEDHPRGNASFEALPTFSEDHPHNSASVGAMPILSDDVQSTSGSHYYSAQELPVIENLI